MMVVQRSLPPWRAVAARFDRGRETRCRRCEASTMVPTNEVGSTFVPDLELIDSNLTIRRVRVPKREVVYVKSIFEASLGVGVIFVDPGGELTVAAPHSRASALDELLVDLKEELGSIMTTAPAPHDSEKTTE